MSKPKRKCFAIVDSPFGIDQRVLSFLPGPPSLSQICPWGSTSHLSSRRANVALGRRANRWPLADSAALPTSASETFGLAPFHAGNQHFVSTSDRREPTDSASRHGWDRGAKPPRIGVEPLGRGQASRGTFPS